MILYCREKLRERGGGSARTLNRHWWIGRVYRGDRVNRGEGTRQNAPVTLEEGGPELLPPRAGGCGEGRRELGEATVYQKHRSVRSRKTMYTD